MTVVESALAVDRGRSTVVTVKGTGAMRLRKLLVGLALVSLVAIACRSSGGTPTSTPASIVPTQVATEEATPVPTAAVTVTPGRIVLKPPDLTVRAANGEQTATIGPFFWVLDSGFAGETTAPGLVLPSEQPLVVKVGEELHFTFGEDRPPQSVKLSVYPQEGNYDKIAPDPDAPKGFVLKTDPALTAEPTQHGATFDWTVPALASGAYFVQVEVEWPQHPKNPRPDKTPRAVYLFWVQISS